MRLLETTPKATRTFALELSEDELRRLLTATFAAAHPTSFGAYLMSDHGQIYEKLNDAHKEIGEHFYE